MVFKLAQVDSENPVKIKLEVGTHILGRGKFLSVNDRRISRQHGQLDVTDNSLIITALHQNPCFYKKRESSETEILRQNSTLNLNIGDRLGLLPSSYWYEVLQSVDNENDKTEKECQENTTHEVPIECLSDETDNEADTEDNEICPVPNENLVLEKNNLQSKSKDVLSPRNLDKGQTTNDSEKENCGNHIASTIEKTGDDSCNPTEFDSEKTQIDEPMTPSLLLSNEINKEKSNESDSSPQSSSTQQKRRHTEDIQNEDVKKIKAESEDSSHVKSEDTSDVKSEDTPEVKFDPDGQQAGSSSNNKPIINPPPVAPAPLRERCMYGASCYRRNPAHQAQYSHPQDADWGAGEKAPCPWGAACGKRDPRHWRDHYHPPGKDQPPPPQGKRKRKDHSNSPPISPNHIVTGKRVRRSVMKVNWTASDDSDSDPYKTDEESDEWEPSSEYTESQN